MWEQVFTVNQAQNSSNFLIDYDFNGSYLIVKSSCQVAKTKWIRAGYCSPLFAIPDVGLVQGKSQIIKLGNQLVNFDSPLGLAQSFKLDFYLEPWLPTIDLTFYAYLPDN